MRHAEETSADCGWLLSFEDLSGVAGSILQKVSIRDYERFRVVPKCKKVNLVEQIDAECAARLERVRRISS